jgi:hypothetical protein
LTQGTNHFSITENTGLIERGFNTHQEFVGLYPSSASSQIEKPFQFFFLLFLWHPGVEQFIFKLCTYEPTIPRAEILQTVIHVRNYCTVEIIIRMINGGKQRCYLLNNPLA